MMLEEKKQDLTKDILGELEEENDLLLLQLHQVQEELENYYLRNQELEKQLESGSQNGVATEKGWVDDELPDIMAENERLRALVNALKTVNKLESENALSVRLGNILIQAVDSPGFLFSLPVKLTKVWRESSRKSPPKSLGGNNFDKVIAAYEKGGFDAVGKLMAEVSVSLTIKANGYTVLARQLMRSDRAEAAEAARIAHALDPKPYRLKWLAFRLHEAGKIIAAEANLEILPPDLMFSDSESRQAIQVRYEAKQIRQLEAKQKAGFSERRAEIDRLVNNLVQERDEKSQLAEERRREAELLKQTKARLEEEKSELAEEHKQTAQLAEERRREAELLKQTQARLEEEKAALAEEHKQTAQLAEERRREAELLKQSH
jgi:hypothetical protein